MNRKNILLKVGGFAKRHKMPVNSIIIIFGIIILACYFKDCVKKIAGCVFMPFFVVWKKIVYITLCIENALSKFFAKHKRVLLKIECGIVSAGLIILIVFNKNTLQNVWGDENTGVFAEEPTKSPDDEETVHIEKEDIEHNNSTSDKIETENTHIENLLPYYIELNRAMNTVTIYTLDNNGEYTVPIMAMRCATGGENTPLGTYALSDRFTFAELLYNSYGQYCTRITGPILFHSSTYTSLNKDSLSAEDYNMLGESVSHGCIRLTTEDAKWIFDNCPVGTVVKIYDDSENPGPLGKPETIKVPAGTKWDPTDPDEANPWNSKEPVIVGAENKILYEYDEYSVRDNIYAYDTCGNDVTEDMIIEGDVDLEIPGVYKVTYKITDAIGNSAETTVYITVI